MNSIEDQNKLLSLALYEIRLLLAPYLGSDNKADMSVRTAAHLSYALHNEALAIIDEKGFDIEEALKKIKTIDRILDDEYSSYFINRYNENPA